MARQRWSSSEVAVPTATVQVVCLAVCLAWCRHCGLPRWMQRRPPLERFTVPALQEHRLFLILHAVYRHPCVFLGPFKSNIAIDLCAPGSLCTQRQTGIFSRVCSRSRKNSQMGIILTLYISWMLLIHNAAQNELPSSPTVAVSSNPAHHRRWQGVVALPVGGEAPFGLGLCWHWARVGRVPGLDNI